MGIGKIILSGDREVIYSGDDCLDRSADGFDEAWSRYDATLDRAAVAAYLHGDPAVFVVAPLTMPQEQHVENQRGLGDRVFESLAYGVHDIRGVAVVDDNGAPVEWKRIKGEHGLRLPPEALAIFRDPTLRWEIFARVRQITGLSKEAAKSNTG